MIYRVFANEGKCINMKSLGKCLLTYLVNLYSLQLINLWLRLPTNWPARSDPCYDSNSDLKNIYHYGKLAQSKLLRRIRDKRYRSQA